MAEPALRWLQEETTAAPRLHYGEGLAVALARLFKGATLYHRGHEIIAQLADDCLHAVRACGEEGALLQVSEDAVFCNRRRVRISADTLAGVKACNRTLRGRGIGLLEFTPAVQAAEITDLAFLLLALDEHGDDNARQLSARLGRHDIESIRVGDLETGGLTNDAETLKRKSREVYFSTIATFKELIANTACGQELELRKVKRLMMTAVHLIMHEESALLGLANIKSFDDYTFSHSVNVAIFSAALGQRVGLPRLALYHLGICGLFHDLGKLSVPLEILNKPGKLDPEEWDVIRTHPVRGAELAIRQRGWGDLLARVMTAAFEHHVKFNQTGYPALTVPRLPSLFSRIVTLADCYDALSRPRVYRAAPFLTEKILGMMLSQGGKDFDPVLVKLLINMVGVYPLGALVLLNTHQMGIVTQIPEDTDLIDRPEVCLLTRAGNTYTRGDTIDLTTRDPGTGDYRWTIQETLDPNDYGMAIEELYL